MTGPRVLAVGGQPVFRHQVAQSLDAPGEAVEWAQAPSDVRHHIANGGGPIDVLVIASDIPNAEAFALSEIVSTSFPTTTIVLVRDQELNGMLPVAMRAGVRDVVDLSKGDAELDDALKRAMAWARSLRLANGNGSNASPGVRGTVVSLFSSKGGTGKTFLASNLATAIARRSGADTALVDLDFGIGDVFSYFGEEPARPIQDLIALGEGADRSNILTCGTSLDDRLHGFGAPPDPAAPRIDAESVGRALKALRSTFPFVVVDLGPEYSDPVLAALDGSDAIFLVTGLDVVGVKHLSKALETLMTIGVAREKLRIVLNRADSKVGIEPGDVERVLKVDVDALIPSSRLVPTSLNNGTPVFVSEPKSEVAKSLGRLADRVIAEAGSSEPNTSNNSKRRLFRRT